MSEFDFADPNKPKAPAIPQFFTEAVKLDFKSREAGRPMFEDQHFVRILIPGDRRSVVVEPLNDEHKARWPREYEAFQKGLEAPVEGTPLKQWPQITASQVQELAYFNIYTVEHMAGVNDAHLQNLGMGARELRDRAKLFLEVAAKGTAPLDRLLSQNERLLAENERLTRELTEANGRANALQQELTHARATA